jgi:hypothetical protein
MGFNSAFKGLKEKKTGECGTFQLFRSMITNYVRCTREIKSSTAMTKAAFNKKTTLFPSKFGLKFKDESSKMLHLEPSFVWR